MIIGNSLVLRDDVVITPVTELDEDTRENIDDEDELFAITELFSGMLSSLVDADTAGILERFRKPCTIVEAVVSYSRERQVEPAEVIEDAYNVVTHFFDHQFIVAVDG